MTIITDVPDGEWQIYIKGDTFNKVMGAVRDRQMVIDLSTDLKFNHLAQATAAYEVRLCLLPTHPTESLV